MARVMHVVYYKAAKQQVEDGPVQPSRNQDSGLWECPTCKRKDFPELSDVLFCSLAFPFLVAWF